MATITTTPVALPSVTQVTVSSGATVYYGTDNTVSPTNHDGTIAVTGVQQFNGPMWIVSASSSVVAYDPPLAVPGTVATPSTGQNTLGSVIGRMQAFDASGNPLGYIPIYDTIT